MKRIIYSLIAVALLFVGSIMLKGDYASFLQWWITILYIGIIFLPLATLVFTNFHDKGYLFAKTIGIATIGYLMWFLSSLHVLKFTPVSCFICVIISLIMNGIILVLRKKCNKNNGIHDCFNSPQYFQNNSSIIDAAIVEELLFFAAFLLFTYIRGFKPEAYGTEKFMDYGFMTSMMRNDYMPPQDFWFAGTNLNYYYVGQYFATFLTKLSLVKVSSAYNLMLMMVGAFSFTLPYSLVYNLILSFMKKKEKKGRFIPPIAGLLSSLAVCLAGNMHYPTFKWFVPLVRKMLLMKPLKKAYWFPDATRFIGYNPDTHDKTIHEFPAYSFVLGDLHAHVINIMFVITVLALLFAWQGSRKKYFEEKRPLWKEVFNPAILLIAFFIGIFPTTNFWDFPIYYVVAGAVILFTNLLVYNFKGLYVAGVTIIQGVTIMVISLIVSLPFLFSFKQIAGKIDFTVARTPLYQLIILWGLPILLVIAFLSFVISDAYKKRKEVLPLEVRKKTSLMPHLFENITQSDLFIMTIGLCAIGLILIPEVIYVQDIYSGDYKRANTMFKLTYQAYIMFGICMGYIFLRLICFGNTMRQKMLAVTGLILFALTVCYIQNAVKGWYGDIFDSSRYQGLDATAFMEKTMPDDYLAINWLNANVKDNPVVLEAPGDSYTDYERVSVMTGLPTILGWRTHEWLWKSDTSILDSRAAEIERIYTSTDVTEVKSILDKYKVAYIYVGKLEQDKYATINHELLKSLGKVVFISPITDTKTYETYIVQISNEG